MSVGGQPVQVMILAAGRSTRLGSLGTVLPKPLVPICGYAAIEFGLALCRHAAWPDVVVNVHHHAGLLQQTLGDGGRFGVRLRYSVETELLGTGGGIAHARPLFGPGPLLVMNGKVVADIDLAAVLAAHRSAPPGTVATMVLRDDPSPGAWAPVTVDAQGRVVGLRDVKGLAAPVGPVVGRMFTGIHVIEAALLDRLPAAGVSDVIGDAYIPALLAGHRIHSVTMSGYFAEHSTPERYLQGNMALLRQPGLVAHPPGSLVGVDPGAAVHPTARIIMPSRVAPGAVVEAGAVVGPDAVICAGGRVAPGAQVEGSVVWSGAVARGQVQATVVTGATSPRP